ncbi:hypothetical protein [Clostridium sp.]|uniref:hypothetical protein n=1 Tax=Clostridium sp. TaxID=1506 RepID=UPI002FCB3A99
MNKNFKFALYFIITILVIGVVAGFFIRILPYLILIGLIMWAIFKIRAYFSRNKNEYDNNDYKETYTYESPENETKDDEEEFDTSKAIDVDYEEVDKK